MLTPQTSGMAVAGFVCSLVSLVFCCGTLSPLSLIFSLVGWSSINKSHNTLGGQGLAIAGFIISLLQIIMWGVVVLLPGAMAAIMAAASSGAGL